MKAQQARALLLFVLLGALLVVGWRVVRVRVEASPRTEDSLFEFDPNTVQYSELRRLGLSARQASNLLVYRHWGGVFRIREQVAAVYGMDDSLYMRLRPYIRIALQTPRRSEYRRLARPRFDRDSARRRWDSLDRRRDSLRAHWDSVYTVRAKPLRVELNGADSLQLLAVSGIGARSAGAILAYRRRLGGFVRADQLTELREVSEANFERMSEQIWVDSCKIQKININFASASVLGRHPYLSPVIVRKLLSNRQLKGGWRNLEELVEAKILTQDQARRLAPYLLFN